MLLDLVVGEGDKQDYHRRHNSQSTNVVEDGAVAAQTVDDERRQDRTQRRTWPQMETTNIQRLFFCL